jgi:hypothetical protein
LHEPAKAVPATAALADITGYDEQQIKFANRIAWGVAAILLGLTGAAFLLCVTVGAFILVRGGLMAARLDVEEYNIDALSELTEEEVASIVGEERAAKVLARTRRGKLTGAICGIIMILATIVGLCLMFYGEPLFWISWMVGGLLCGIAGIVPVLIESLSSAR